MGRPPQRRAPAIGHSGQGRPRTRAAYLGGRRLRVNAAGRDPLLVRIVAAVLRCRVVALLDGPPPPGHAAHWLTWRRRHQALARWYHHCTRLARNANIALVTSEWPVPYLVV